MTNVADFWFGMTMEMDFYMPKDGNVLNPSTNELQEMIFSFSGDDDVWVFVDGVLVLDIGGCHAAQIATINFYTGEVVDPTGETTLKQKFIDAKAEDSSISLDDFNVTAEDGDTDTFKDYSKHTLKMFYLERGANLSSLFLEFNMPILPKHSLNVEKTISGDEIPQLGNPNFKFQILDEADGIKLANAEYDVYDIDTGALLYSSITDINGCFTIKSGQRATFEGLEANQGKFKVQELLDIDFFKQYCEVTVDGTIYTNDLIRPDIVIGEERFKGFTSPDKNIADGRLFYIFDNKIDVEEYGSLSITKRFDDYTFENGYNPYFNMYVTFDNIPIQVGARYLINGEEYIVETEGIIPIRIGETAVIPDIISASNYRVIETSESTDGYCTVYTNNEGTIQNKTQSDIVVLNIPAGNILPNTGGSDYTFYIGLAMMFICSTMYRVRKSKM